MVRASGMASGPTLGEILYLAWWREYEHGHGYDHEAWLNLPERHRNAYEAAAQAVAETLAADEGQASTAGGHRP